MQNPFRVPVPIFTWKYEESNKKKKTRRGHYCLFVVDHHSAKVFLIFRRRRRIYLSIIHLAFLLILPLHVVSVLKENGSLRKKGGMGNHFLSLSSDLVPIISGSATVVMTHHHHDSTLGHCGQQTSPPPVPYRRRYL